jgi:hypothetical protein
MDTAEVYVLWARELNYCKTILPVANFVHTLYIFRGHRGDRKALDPLHNGVYHPTVDMIISHLSAHAGALESREEFKTFMQTVRFYHKSPCHFPFSVCVVSLSY